jgi:hypothetical protein
MTPSPELMDELRAGRPTAPAALRARVREIAANEPAPRPSFSLLGRVGRPAHRVAVIAVPAAAALAIAGAGVIGLARSDAPPQVLREQAVTDDQKTFGGPESTESTPLVAPQTGARDVAPPAIGPAADRTQRVSATLTLEVADSDGVSRAAQEALALTRRLGGHVVSASVVTGEQGAAQLTVRVPVARVQEAIVQLSALGEIVSQQVTIDDLQEGIDASKRRQRSVRAQIALITSRLESETLDAATRARLEARLKTLREELRTLRRTVSALNAEGRMATIQVGVVTPDSQGVVSPPSKLNRTLDEALNVLVWEAVVALAVLIVAAPFALVALAAWLGRRLYRRREDERLLAT